MENITFNNIATTWRNQGDYARASVHDRVNDMEWQYDALKNEASLKNGDVALMMEYCSDPSYRRRWREIAWHRFTLH